MTIHIPPEPLFMKDQLMTFTISYEVNRRILNTYLKRFFFSLLHRAF